MGTPRGANSRSRSPPKRPARSWALSNCVSIANPLAVDLAGRGLRQLVLNHYLLRHHIRRRVLYDVLPDRFHGVLPANEVEETVFVAPDEVPGVDYPLPVEEGRGSHRVRAVRLGGSLLLT